MNTEELIQYAKENALRGKVLDRYSIIKLLEIDPNSKEAEKLGESARDVAREVVSNKGKVWASIGVDYQPCSMNCSFCSFGEKWAATKESYTWSDNEVISFVRKFASEGASWITLRTTEFFGFDRLCELAKKIRSTVPGNYKLVANTGEFNDERARILTQAGFEIVYHSVRLNEGVDTPFLVENRCKTLKAIQNTNMDLAHLVEPIGIEHTNEEIADVFITALNHGAKLSGAMSRIPIPGTPLYHHGQLPERRLAQIVAITRLAAGNLAPDICVHPPSQLAMEWGANVVVVDVGAVPRDSNNLNSEWQSFDVKTAKKWFKNAGYED